MPKVFAIPVNVSGKKTAKIIKTVKPKKAIRRNALASVDERWCSANHNKTKITVIRKN
jgi:hypothetical protein